MNYHNITKEDMLNGEGLRVVLWVSGCEHRCKGCHNSITWDVNSGILFDEKAEEELFQALDRSYIDGITFSGGDPLHPSNRSETFRLIKKCRSQYPQKTIWLYTGYNWEQIKEFDEIQLIDVVAEGKFIEELKNNNKHWVGSSNQKVIKVKETIQNKQVISA